ncbi:MAG: hypothetical protein SOY60_09120 [Fusobacterium gastrosuis]|nr:hypothetical protein [Fusobacterium gastrosuis]
MEKFLEIKKDKLGIGTWKMGDYSVNRKEEIGWYTKETIIIFKIGFRS